MGNCLTTALAGQESGFGFQFSLKNNLLRPSVPDSSVNWVNLLLPKASFPNLSAGKSRAIAARRLFLRSVPL